MTGLPAESGLWLRRFHAPAATGIRLVCFPHAGGSASFYHPVSAALSAEMEVLAVQYPGRQDRRGEPSITSVPALADRLATVVSPLAADRLAFFGHSMGAILAFEVALRLARQSNQELTHLFASGRRAPSCYRDEMVHKRDDDGILAELRRLDGTNQEITSDPEIIEMIMPALRGDYFAIETYRHHPGDGLTCPVTALVGASDQKTTVDEARAWSAHTTGPFDLHVFTGGHFYLIQQQRQVTELLATRLRAAERTG